MSVMETNRFCGSVAVPLSYCTLLPNVVLCCTHMETPHVNYHLTPETPENTVQQSIMLGNTGQQEATGYNRTTVRLQSRKICLSPSLTYLV